MSVTVNIEGLRVGMFVHLDLGWWAHPFALSSFVVTSAEQIDTIRGLGLKKLRWSPEKSRVDGAVPAGGAKDLLDIGRAGAAAANSPLALAVALTVGLEVDAGAAPEPGGSEAAPPLPSGDAKLPAHSPLSSQRAAQQLCEQQYAEAGVAWHAAQQQLSAAPGQTRAITEGLTQALLAKLMVDRQMCVRVLSDVGGDRTSGHALNVAVISLLMARVFGFGAADLLDIGMGALLHDVGKADLPERLRHGHSHLAAAELRLYREHVAHGVAQGRRMGLSEGALAVLAQHHEMADGSGFPAGLNLDRMNIAARIVALVNRYDNLCNPPQATQSLTPHEALSLIFAQSRGKFDTTMLTAFIRMMGVYPPGSVVQLTDNRYASVVSVNSSRPLKPRVLVCDPRVPAAEALLLNLDGQVDLGIRRSLKPAQLPAAVRDYLAPRPRMVYFFEPVSLEPTAAMEALAA